MERYEYISELISKYLKPIFSFTLKRTKTIQDAVSGTTYTSNCIVNAVKDALQQEIIK